MADDFASIDVEAFDVVVSELESTFDGLTNDVAPLRPEFEYFGVDMSNLNLLRTTQFVLEDVVPDLRERHRLAHQLLVEQADHPALGGGTVVSFEGDLLNDADLVHRADVAESIDHLKNAGLLDIEPGPRYREWISWTLSAGLSPQDVVERARQEGVTADTFDLLGDVTIWRTPDGRPYARIEDAGNARAIVRLIELLNGGEPSETDERRDANSWSYTGAGSGLDMILSSGGAVAATPHGTMMAAPGPAGPSEIIVPVPGPELGPALGIGGLAPRLEVLGGIPTIPNTADLFAFKAVTTWGEIAIINGSYEDPVDLLYNQTIRAGEPPPQSIAPSLDRLLQHELAHSAQWAHYGAIPFMMLYLSYIHEDPCQNPFEIMAGLDDMGHPPCS